MPAEARLGSDGPEVRVLQEALVAQGYYIGQIDGYFGERTQAAVTYFKSVCGLPMDGVADQGVYDYLGIVE